MNIEQIAKRDKAFQTTVIVCGLILTVYLIAALVGIKEKTINVVIRLLFLPMSFFWFKGFYHWSIAKGYPRHYLILGIIGLPFGMAILSRLEDRNPEPSVT